MRVKLRALNHLRIPRESAHGVRPVRLSARKHSHIIGRAHGLHTVCVNTHSRPSAHQRLLCAPTRPQPSPPPSLRSTRKLPHAWFGSVASSRARAAQRQQLFPLSQQCATRRRRRRTRTRTRAHLSTFSHGTAAAAAVSRTRTRTTTTTTTGLTFSLTLWRERTSASHGECTRARVRVCTRVCDKM